MDYITFSAAINSLSVYFDKKPPTEVQKELWFDMCRFIPNESVKDIVQEIKKNSDRFPSNVGKAFRAGWFLWKANHLGKVIPYPQTDCDHCGGAGLLWHRLKTPNIKWRREQKDLRGKIVETREGFFRYEFFSRCASCENWRRHVTEDVPARSRSELEKGGFEVFPYPYEPMEQVTIEEAAARVGRRI